MLTLTCGELALAFEPSCSSNVNARVVVLMPVCALPNLTERSTERYLCSVASPVRLSTPVWLL
jgi:hypothetical protein